MTKMKKITVTSNFHTGSTATFYIPEYIETTTDAMHWLESEADREACQLYYGPARAKHRRVWRQLCGVTECKCAAWVKKEEI